MWVIYSNRGSEQLSKPATMPLRSAEGHGTAPSALTESENRPTVRATRLPNGRRDPDRDRGADHPRGRYGDVRVGIVCGQALHGVVSRPGGFVDAGSQLLDGGYLTVAGKDSQAGLGKAGLLHGQHR